MEETKSDNKQLCHDLRPLFEGTRRPLKLKKVRKRLQAQTQSVAVKRLIATYGLEKLSSLTKRLVNEGSLRLAVSALVYSPSTGADTNVVPDRTGQINVETRSKWSLRRDTNPIFDGILRYVGKDKKWYDHVR
jgi:hypothetical protein